MTLTRKRGNAHRGAFIWILLNNTHFCNSRRWSVEVRIHTLEHGNEKTRNFYLWLLCVVVVPLFKLINRFSIKFRHF